jgi:hypothetical protein
MINRTRQNHALEHGTISVLLERSARTPLGGNAAPGGFFVYGQVATDDLASAAEEALRRLQAGQRELAVSPFCGTNLVVGALLAGVLSGIIMGRSKGRVGRVPLLATAILGSMLVGRPLGGAVQRRYTTEANVGDVSIAGIRCFRPGRYTVHYVRTSRTAAWSA